MGLITKFVIFIRIFFFVKGQKFAPKNPGVELNISKNRRNQERKKTMMMRTEMASQLVSEGAAGQFKGVPFFASENPMKKKN